MSTSEIELTLETNIVMPTSMGGPKEENDEQLQQLKGYNYNTFVVGSQSLIIAVDKRINQPRGIGAVTEVHFVTSEINKYWYFIAS